MKRYVLIVAGGRGLRMGSDLPKQFIPMEGKPVLMHTLEAFHRWDASAGLILVLPEDHQPYWKMLCREIGCKVPHRIANGGETRFHSVRNGLNFLSDEIGNAAGRDEKILVAVHDGVRPFAAPEVIDRCFAEAEVSGAAIPVVPVVDSLREFSGESTNVPSCICRASARKRRRYCRRKPVFLRMKTCCSTFRTNTLTVVVSTRWQK